MTFHIRLMDNNELFPQFHMRFGCSKNIADVVHKASKNYPQQLKVISGENKQKLWGFPQFLVSYPQFWTLINRIPASNRPG